MSGAIWNNVGHVYLFPLPVNKTLHIWRKWSILSILERAPKLLPGNCLLCQTAKHVRQSDRLWSHSMKLRLTLILCWMELCMCVCVTFSVRQIKRKQDDIRNLVCILDVEPQFLIPTVSRPLQWERRRCVLINLPVGHLSVHSFKDICWQLCANYCGRCSGRHSDK